MCGEEKVCVCVCVFVVVVLDERETETHFFFSRSLYRTCVDSIGYGGVGMVVL